MKFEVFYDLGLPWLSLGDDSFVIITERDESDQEDDEDNADKQMGDIDNAAEK